MFLFNQISKCLLILLLAAGAASAYEVRTWQDQDGSEFTGRFYREMFGKITIETEEGDKRVLTIEDLSDLDKKYVRVMVPPIIEISTRKKTIDIPPRPALYTRLEKKQNHVVSATITKKSQRPFTSRLEAEFFLVAEEYGSGENILLSHSKESFLLLEEKEYRSVVSSEPAETTLTEDLLTKRLRGEEYKGHHLIITSMQGDVVAVDSGLPKWMQQPDVLENLRELAVRGAPSVRSRYFDKTGKKIPPPRLPYIQPWAR